MSVTTSPAERGTLAQLIEERIRLTSSNRVRGLSVEVVAGRIVLKGRVLSRHAKQLVLHAALEFVSGDELDEQIAVV